MYIIISSLQHNYQLLCEVLFKRISDHNHLEPTVTPEKSKLVQRISTFHNDKISSFLLLFSVQWTFCRVDVDEQFTSRGSAVASRSVGISRKELGEGGSKVTRSRRQRHRGGGEWDGGIPLPSWLGGLGERRKLPSGAENGFWCILSF